MICRMRRKKDRQSVKSSGLILISVVLNTIFFFFLAVNTFFLALGELIYFSQSTFNCKSIVHCFTLNKSNLRNFFLSNVFIDEYLKSVKRIFNY